MLVIQKCRLFGHNSEFSTYLANYQRQGIMRYLYGYLTRVAKPWLNIFTKMYNNNDWYYFLSCSYY